MSPPMNTGKDTRQTYWRMNEMPLRGEVILLPFIRLRDGLRRADDHSGSKNFDLFGLLLEKKERQRLEKDF